MGAFLPESIRKVKVYAKKQSKKPGKMVRIKLKEQDIEKHSLF